MLSPGYTSQVRRENDRIIKIVTRREHGVVEREIDFLRTLHGCGFTPELYDANVESGRLEMEFVGDDLSDAKLPDDAWYQMQRISEILYSLGIRHNDIRPENVTVQNGRLFLIDWQWATRYNMQPPEDWPKGLGTSWRSGWPRWEFDDRVSFARVLAWSARQNSIRC